MYIEFSIPNDADIAGLAFLVIRRRVIDWSNKYQIAYTEKTIKGKHRVCFDQDKYYEFFALTFEQTHDFLQFRIVSDLNNKI